MNLLDKINEYNKVIENDKYFDLKKVNALNIPYDILIITSQRNVGKSYQIYKLIEELKEGEYFVLIRTLKEELKALANHFATDNNSNIDIIGDKIYLKEYDGDKKLLPISKRRLVGRTASMRNSSNYKSAFGDGFKFLVYDEFIDDNNRKICDVALMDFLSLMVSIKRKTPEFKAYLFSNLFGDRTILLNQMGIDKTKEIEYKTSSITYKSKKITNNILYLNLKNKFDGINNDPSLALALQLNKQIAEAWKSNSTIKSSKRVIAGAQKELFNTIYSFTNGKYIWHLKTYETQIKGKNLTIAKTVYLLEDTIFYNTSLKTPIYTVSENVYNLYETQFLTKKRFNRLFRFLMALAKKQSLFLSSSNTLEEFMLSFKDSIEFKRK